MIAAEEFNKAMTIVFAIAAESMKQEQSRSETLIIKSDNLIKYVTAVMGVINSAFVFLFDKETIISQHVLLISIFWINIPFLISLCLAVLAQTVLPKQNYPSGIQVLDDMRSAQFERNYQVYQLRCMASYTDALNKSDNIRARLVLYSNISYIWGFLTILMQICIVFFNDFKDMLEVLRYYVSIILIVILLEVKE